MWWNKKRAGPVRSSIAIANALELGSTVKSRLVCWNRLQKTRRWIDYGRTLSRSRKVCSYIGWVGHRNVGDEALYQVFRDVLFPKLLMTLDDDFSVLSWMTKRNRAAAPTLLGGGTLINVKPYYEALYEASKRGAPFAVFGTGVSDLAFWSRHPSHTERGGSALWPELLKRSKYVGVRGPRSAEWLESHGVPHVEIVGDAALSLPKVKAKKGDQFLVGINLGSHDPIDGDKEKLFQATLQLARYVLRQGAKIVYFSLHQIDWEIGRRLQCLLGDIESIEFLPLDMNVARVCSQIAKCDVVVGQRLHATVLACGQGVANLSLSYQPKCFDFLESIGQSRLALDTSSISGDVLIDQYQWLIENQLSVASGIDAECDRFRKLQITRAQTVQSILYDKTL